MVFPIISRGIIARDDGLDSSLSQFNGGSVTSAVITTDGDILDYATTFTNPSAGDFAAAYRPISATPTNTYPSWFIRYRFVTQPANYTVQAYFHFTNSTSQVNYGADNSGNAIVPNMNFQVGHYVAPSNLSFDRMGIIITAQNGAMTA